MVGLTGSRPALSPCWLWPNLLSLDAPLVALAWQWLFHHSFHLALPFRLQVTLGMAVWMIYVLDRCLDVWSNQDGAPRTPRHLFYHRHWRPMLALAVGLGSLMLWMAHSHLRPLMFAAGMGLGLLILGYLLLVHRFTRRHSLTGLKEPTVGILFATGVTLSLWIWLTPKPAGFYVTFVIFALLATCNCLLIDGWEQRASSPPAGWLRWMLTLSPLLILTCPGSRGCLDVCLALSGLGLALLAWWGSHLSENARRVLVDAVLLTPFAAMAFSS
jgi:hypothetical protein